QPSWTRLTSSSAPTKSAPASWASRTLSPCAKTATRTFLPVPFGSTTVPRVDAQPDVRLDRRVELRRRRLPDHLHGRLGVEPSVAVRCERGLDLLGRLLVLLPSLPRHRPLL